MFTVPWGTPSYIMWTHTPTFSSKREDSYIRVLPKSSRRPLRQTRLPPCENEGVVVRWWPGSCPSFGVFYPLGGAAFSYLLFFSENAARGDP